jgi:hypothetical protein
MLPTDSSEKTIFPACRRIAGPEKWDGLLDELPEAGGPEALPDLIAGRLDACNLPPFLADLAAIEARMHRCAGQDWEEPAPGGAISVNPSLSLFKAGWRNLPGIIRQQRKAAPEPGEEFIMIWRQPGNRGVHVRSAQPSDLLALKLVLENLDKREIARIENTTLAALDGAITAAVQQGILLAPPSAIRRDPSLFAPDLEIPKKYLSAQVFTLQWHITQACDLRCKHCYDRSDRSPSPWRTPWRPWTSSTTSAKPATCTARSPFPVAIRSCIPDFSKSTGPQPTAAS